MAVSLERRPSVRAEMQQQNHFCGKTTDSRGEKEPRKRRNGERRAKKESQSRGTAEREPERAGSQDRPHVRRRTKRQECPREKARETIYIFFISGLDWTATEKEGNEGDKSATRENLGQERCRDNPSWTTCGLRRHLKTRRRENKRAPRVQEG